jgi:hypothetical protein
LGWLATRGFEPYPAMYRIRHTMLHAAQGDWKRIPADGLWRFTEPSLTPADPIVARGGRILREKVSALAPIALGDAAITAGGALAQPFVLHLAALEGGRIASKDALQSAVRAALALSHNQWLRTVLIPMPSPLQGLSADEFARSRRRDHQRLPARDAFAHRAVHPARRKRGRVSSVAGRSQPPTRGVEPAAAGSSSATGVV